MGYGTIRNERQATGARWIRRLIAIAIAVQAAVGLGACSSNGMRYHTLSNYADIGTKTSGVITSKDSDALLIEVLPIRTSEALSTTRFMIGHDDGSMTPAPADEWTAPLPDELRGAISQALQQRLGAVDLYNHVDTGKTRRLQIAATLAKADFSDDRRFSGVVEWSVKAIPADESIVGRTSLNLDIVGGADGQVTAFQKLSNSVAGDVAVAARAISSYTK